MSDLHFYSNLPFPDVRFRELLSDEACFHYMPDSWYVIVCDIKGATNAYAQKKYKQINALASGALSVALKKAEEFGVDVPFVYGGDGATIVVPEEMKEELIGSLLALRLNGLNAFGLNLRVGSLRVSDIRGAGYNVSVAKLSLKEQYNQAVFKDTGLYYAENRIKDDETLQVVYEPSVKEDTPIDLKNLDLHYRTEYIPKENEELVCLIVEVKDTHEHLKKYKEIMDGIADIYGTFERRHPLFKKRSGTVNVSLEETYILSRLKNKQYILEFVNSVQRRKRGFSTNDSLSLDLVKLDGNLKMLLIGDQSQGKALKKFLDEKEQQGTLLYGILTTRSRIITSVIHQNGEHYIGLVDAGEGGYILAAKELKKKKGLLK